ncbi:MAG: HlyC/CorC family transporter [Lentisphaerae bacterium]|nr:HlyC/CorC family transporter [Lentisphaerota bacterium]MCP4101554.1 HlyC/CorC family transporter [Lentisphaerota bacterium]
MDNEFLIVGIFVFVLLMTAWDALREISLGRIRRIEVDNKKLARKMENWLEHQEGFEIVFRFLNLLLLSIISTALFYKLVVLFPDKKFPVIIGYMLIGVVVVLVLSVIVAQLLLIKLDILILRLTLPVLNILRCSIFSPVIALARLTESSASHFGGADHSEEKTTAEDEIMSLVEHDDEEGEESLEEDEKRMIRGVFDLNDTPVREIMTPRVDMSALSSSSSIADAKQMIIESGHSRIPVYGENIDAIKGVIYAKDFLDDTRKSEKLEDYSHKPLFIPETKNVGDLLEEFQANKIHVAVIIDEYGGTSGIVTLEDIIEEIVGEIRDEYDIDEKDTINVMQDDGTIITEGRTLISNINEEFDMEIPEDEDVDTVGGYVCGEFGKIPEENEEISIEKVGKFKIIKADRRKVTSILITPLRDEDED